MLTEAEIEAMKEATYFKRGEWGVRTEKGDSL